MASLKIEGGRALALLRGRDYVLATDIVDLAPDVLRHRLVLSYEALSRATSADEIIMKILSAIRAPDAPLQAHVKIAQAS